MSNIQVANKLVAIELQDKVVEPSTQVQEITADSGYVGLNKVSVGAVEYAPPTKAWLYVTEYDDNGYPIKAKTIGVSGDMPPYLCSSYYYKGYLQEFEINSSVTSIGRQAFSGCSSCLLFDFRNATRVPTLVNVNAFTDTNDTFKIVVPDSLYDSWITATNWSASGVVEHIIKASEYEV